MADPIQWLSTQQAADHLGITTRTLYRLIDGGDLVAFKIGRVIRLKQTDVEKFIDASKVQPGTLKHLYPDPRTDAADEAGMA